MKKKVSIITSALFVLTITAVLMSPSTGTAGYGFWYGTDITENLSPAAAEALDEFLLAPPDEGGLGFPGSMMFGMFGYDSSAEADLEGCGPDEPWNCLTTYDPSKTWDGYTLLSSFGGIEEGDKSYRAILIDMNGNIINKWALLSFPAKMLPGGSVVGGAERNPETSPDQPDLFYDFAFQELTALPALVQQDWCGNEEWRWEGNPDDAWKTSVDWNFDPDGPRGPQIPYLIEKGTEMISGWHHDFQTGHATGYYNPGMPPRKKPCWRKTLILGNYLPEQPEIFNDPDKDEDTLDISDFRLYDDIIYEVDCNGNVLFRWLASDHFDDADCGGRPGCLSMGFADDAKEAIMDVRNGAFNYENATDYQHFNNVGYVGPNKHFWRGDKRFHPHNIVFDARSSNISGIIARYDNLPHWQAGDIVWRVGPTFEPDKPWSKLNQIIGQHHFHIIQPGLPGAGNGLMFDNGGGAGQGPLIKGLTPVNMNKFRNYSRVIEFNPITLKKVWEYTRTYSEDENGDGFIQGGEQKFFSFFISSAQKLKNGNYLICEGAQGRIFEITPEKEVVWEFFSPFVGALAPGLDFVGRVYRAYRIPYWWVPKYLLRKGCPEPVAAAK